MTIKHKHPRKVRAEIRKMRFVSHWDKAVQKYAIELCDHWIENLKWCDTPNNVAQLERILLNGAENWLHFSEAGCSLVFTEDIAHRLLTPSAYKIMIKRQNIKWMEMQALAISQAAHIIYQVWLN